MSQGHDDQVLMDYLATLLSEGEQQTTEPQAEPATVVFPRTDFPMTCLRARVGDASLSIPINQLAGMQALAGPLYVTKAWQGLPTYLPSPHGQMLLLDVAAVLQQTPSNYVDSAWRGHLLKLKDQQLGVLVDAIQGPMEQQQAPAKDQVQRLAWADVACLEDASEWLIANVKG